MLHTEVKSLLVAVKGRTAQQCVKQTLELLHTSHLSFLHIHRGSGVGLSALRLQSQLDMLRGVTTEFNLRFTSGTRRKGPGHLFVLLIVQYDSVAGSK